MSFLRRGLRDGRRPIRLRKTPYPTRRYFRPEADSCPARKIAGSRKQPVFRVRERDGKGPWGQGGWPGDQFVDQLFELGFPR